MSSKIVHTDIEDAILIEPQVFKDDRGVFVETFRQEWLPKSSKTMVQGNRASRKANTLVGLHFHKHQSDFWYVPFGQARAVIADIRQDSPTFGKTYSVILSGENHFGLYIPPGVAHGFYSITDMTITYLVDNYYNPDDELGVAWNDPLWKSKWEISQENEPSLTISQRDSENNFLDEWSKDDLPTF